MPMTTTTDTESGSRRTLPPGEYFFKVLPEVEFSETYVIRTEDSVSNAGNEQIILALEIGNKEGTVKVADYLAFTEAAAWKISTFLKAVGAYPGSGVDIDLHADMFIGMKGRCETMLEKKGDYENVKVKRYIAAEKQDPSILKPKVMTEDEIPF
jgi:hypothetical protein